MNRAGIYARLSLAEENSTFTDRQKKDCRDHAKSLNLEIGDEVRHDQLRDRMTALMEDRN